MRGLALGVVAVPLAAAAHVLGGGTTPSLGLVLGLVALLAGGAGALRRRRVSPLQVVLVLVGTQVLLHAVFVLAHVTSMLHGAGSSLRATAMPGMPGMGAVTAGTSSWPVIGAHLRSEISTTSGLTMLASHVVAAVLVGLWLASVERLGWSLLSLLTAPRAAALLRRASEAPAALLVALRALAGWVGAPARTAPWRPHAWLLHAPSRRRGPPVTPCALVG